MDIVDLRSDTKTKPSRAMREAIANADVGDEQSREDPTTTALEERVALLLGMDAGVFVPSGTMCNIIAFRLHIRPGGDEVVLDRTSHPLNAETGGPAVHSGALVSPLSGERGIFTADQLRGAIRTSTDPHTPRTRLVSIEQTTNMGGGAVWSIAQLRAVRDVAKESGLRVHMDGARLLNAAVALGTDPEKMTEGFDTAWLDLSKGLGAPIGAVLVGSDELMTEARRMKQLFGGAMRQSGILAAAGMYALDHNVDRLAEDHENARVLAEELADIKGCEIDPSHVETNIVIFAVDSPSGLCEKLKSEGVLMGPVGRTHVRAVTHLDVDSTGIKRAAEAVRRVLRSA